MSPTKRRHLYGQHFLRDQGIISKIVSHLTAQLKTLPDEQTVDLIEIGPGKGALTFSVLEALKDSSAKITLIEKDPKLFNFWQQNKGNAQFIGKDFLKLDPLEYGLGGSKKIGVLSNLPYSVGTTITTQLCQSPKLIKFMVLMFQKEVADRLMANVGSKDWGSLSIWVQNNWSVTHLLDVPPKSFYPPPKVDSSVLLLKPLTLPKIEILDEPLFEKLLKVSFAYRRKMLRSGLPKEGPWLEAIDIAQIDPTRRAETLDWNEWARLYQAVQGKK